MTVNFAKIITESQLTSLINPKDLTEHDLKEILIKPVYFELVNIIANNIFLAKLDSSHYFRFEMRVSAIKAEE